MRDTAYLRFLESRRIIAAGVPGVTAADARGAAPRAAHGAVLAHGQDKILAAARIEATGRRQQRAQAPLVEANAANQHGRQDGSHDRAASAASRRAACCTRRGSDCINSASV